MAPEAKYSRSDFVAVLAGSISSAVAEEKIVEAASLLQLSTETFTPRDAQAILEHIAQESGLVGIAARFAKSRVALRWKK
ncbi:MAG TPA: hypothetical protein VGM56_23575 [Byssovorax sp.]|jgi:hypothetical protein